MLQSKKLYTLTQAANHIGAALLLFILLSQVLRLLGEALLRSASPAPPEWATGLYNLLLALGSFVPAVLILRKQHTHTLTPPSKIQTKLPLWVLLGLFLGIAVGLNAFTTLLEAVFLRLLHLPLATQAALPNTPSGLWLYFLTVSIAAPVLEELLFRGAIQPILRPWGAGFSWVCTSILFTLLHASIWDLPAVFGLSLLLCAVAEFTGEVKVSMLLHGVNNALVFLQLLLRSRPGVTWGTVLIVFVIAIQLALFVLALLALRQNRLGTMLRVRQEKILKPQYKSRLRRMAEAPAFAMGFVAVVVFFIYRLFTP